MIEKCCTILQDEKSSSKDKLEALTELRRLFPYLSDDSLLTSMEIVSLKKVRKILKDLMRESGESEFPSDGMFILEQVKLALAMQETRSQLKIFEDITDSINNILELFTSIQDKNALVEVCKNHLQNLLKENHLYLPTYFATESGYINCKTLIECSLRFEDCSDRLVTVPLKIAALHIFLCILKRESNLVDFTPIDKLKNDLSFWIELILPLLYVLETKELREAVMNCFDIINIHSSEYCETESYSKFKKELKTKYIPVMVKLAEVSSPDWDRLWCFSLDLLGDFIQKKECHTLMNELLVVVEKAFKATDTHTRMNAFTCWQHLIDKFLSNSLDDFNRRVKLLLMPLTASNTKTPELTRKKLDVWWHLVRRLEGRTDYLERVVVPFLNYCFGPLKETPFPSYQKTPLLGSPGKREPSNHQACISAMFGILSRNPRRKEDGDLLDPLPVVLLQSPESFLKISRPVIHSVGECTLMMIINKGEESRVRQLWALLMCHVNSVLQSLNSNSISVDKVVEMVKDVLRVIVGLLDLVKTSESFLPLAPLIVNPILDLVVNGPYPLPCWVLMSQVYYVGSAGLMSGTPALMVVDMLFSPTLLNTRSLSCGSKHHMFVLKAVLKLAIAPRAFTLDFVLALMKRVDAASNESYLDSCDAFLVWGVVVRALIRFLEKDGELNQGNNLVHDFSTLYTVLIFPLQHVHEAENSQVSELTRLWSHLFKIFNTNANMVATIEVNEVGEHLCSKMMTIVKKPTLTMTQLITLAHALKDIVNVIPYGAIDKVTPKKVKSTHFHKKLQEKPLQNISNVLNSLTTLAECLKVRSSLDSCNFVGASLAQAMSVIFAKMTTSTNIVPLVSKLSEAVHTILKLPSKPSAGWGEMDLQVFQLLLSFTKFIEIGMNKVGLAKLVTHITPSIEAAFGHHSNKLRNIAIRFWSDILSPAFAKDSVTIPPNLMQAFEKSLLKDSDAIPEDDTENSMNVVSGIPKLSGTFMSKNTGSKRLSPLKPNPSTPILVSQITPISHQSGSKSLTWDCKIASVSVMKNPVPVLISTVTPLRSRPLTVHQKEMMRKRRDDIPAMYVDLTQDTQTQFTEESQSQDSSVEAISRNNRETIPSAENQQADLVTTFTNALSSQITRSSPKTTLCSEMSTSQSPISANANEQSKTLPAASGSLQSTSEAQNNIHNTRLQPEPITISVPSQEILLQPSKEVEYQEPTNHSNATGGFVFQMNNIGTSKINSLSCSEVEETSNMEIYSTKNKLITNVVENNVGNSLATPHTPTKVVVERLDDYFQCVENKIPSVVRDVIMSDVSTLKKGKRGRRRKSIRPEKKNLSMVKRKGRTVCPKSTDPIERELESLLKESVSQIYQIEPSKDVSLKNQPSLEDECMALEQLLGNDIMDQRQFKLNSNLERKDFSNLEFPCDVNNIAFSVEVVSEMDGSKVQSSILSKQDHERSIALRTRKNKTEINGRLLMSRAASKEVLNEGFNDKAIHVHTVINETPESSMENTFSQDIVESSQELSSPIKDCLVRLPKLMMIDDGKAIISCATHDVFERGPTRNSPYRILKLSQSIESENDGNNENLNLTGYKTAKYIRKNIFNEESSDYDIQDNERLKEISDRNDILSHDISLENTSGNTKYPLDHSNLMVQDAVDETFPVIEYSCGNYDGHGVTSNSSSIESLENNELTLSSLKMQSTPDIHENKAVSLSKDNEGLCKDQDHDNKSKPLYEIKEKPEKEENAIADLNDDREAHSKGNDMEVFDDSKKIVSSNKNKGKAATNQGKVVSDYFIKAKNNEGGSSDGKSSSPSNKNQRCEIIIDGNDSKSIAINAFELEPEKTQIIKHNLLQQQLNNSTINMQKRNTPMEAPCSDKQMDEVNHSVSSGIHTNENVLQIIDVINSNSGDQASSLELNSKVNKKCRSSGKTTITKTDGVSKEMPETRVPIDANFEDKSQVHLDKDVCQKTAHENKKRAALNTNEMVKWFSGNTTLVNNKVENTLVMDGGKNTTSILGNKRTTLKYPPEDSDKVSHEKNNISGDSSHVNKKENPECMYDIKKKVDETANVKDKKSSENMTNGNKEDTLKVTANVCKNKTKSIKEMNNMFKKKKKNVKVTANVNRKKKRNNDKPVNGNDKKEENVKNTANKTENKKHTEDTTKLKRTNVNENKNSECTFNLNEKKENSETPTNVRESKKKSLHVNGKNISLVTLVKETDKSKKTLPQDSSNANGEENKYVSRKMKTNVHLTLNKNLEEAKLIRTEVAKPQKEVTSTSVRKKKHSKDSSSLGENMIRRTRSMYNKEVTLCPNRNNISATNENPKQIKRKRKLSLLKQASEKVNSIKTKSDTAQVIAIDKSTNYDDTLNGSPAPDQKDTQCSETSLKQNLEEQTSLSIENIDLVQTQIEANMANIHESSSQMPKNISIEDLDMRTEKGLEQENNSFPSKVYSSSNQSSFETKMSPDPIAKEPSTNNLMSSDLPKFSLNLCLVGESPTKKELLKVSTLNQTDDNHLNMSPSIPSPEKIKSIENFSNKNSSFKNVEAIKNLPIIPPSSLKMPHLDTVHKNMVSENASTPHNLTKVKNTPPSSQSNASSPLEGCLTPKRKKRRLLPRNRSDVEYSTSPILFKKDNKTYNKNLVTESQMCNDDTFYENDVIPSSQQMPESTILKQNLSDRNQPIMSPKETISETDTNEKMALTETPLDKTPPKTCSGNDSVTPETSPGQSFPSFASPRSRALMSSMKLMSPSCLSLIKRNNIRTNSNRSAQILDMTRALDVDNPKSDTSPNKLDLDSSSDEHRENESLASRLMKKKKIVLPAKDRLLMYSSDGRLLELDYTRHNYSADASPSSSNLKRKLEEEEEAERTGSPPKKKRVSFTDPPRSLELHFNQTLAEMSLRHRSFSEKEMPTMIKRRLGFISRRLADNLMNYEDESEETPTNRANVPSQVNQLDNNSNNVDSEDLSQGSVVETLSTQFNEVDSIYPSLIRCQHPIESLVPLLVEPMWTNQLTKTFHNRLISTVGDLALQTEAIVNTFPLKEPKIQRVRTKLQEYEKEFMEINERKRQVTTEISEIEMLPITLKQATSVSSQCKSDDSVEELCRQILQKKSANEALKIMLDQISGSNNTDEFTSLPPGVGDVIAERWSISSVMSHYLDRAKKYPSPSTSQLKQEMFDFITMQFSKGEFFKSIANRSENHPNILKYVSDEKLLSEVMVRKSLQKALLESDIISQWDIETIFDKCITTFGVERVFRGLCNAHKIELSVKGFVILRFLCQKLGPEWICKQLDKGDVVKFLVQDMGSETIFDHIPLPQFISWVSKNDKLWKYVTARVKEADKNSPKIDTLEERLENILDEIAPKSILEKISDDDVIQYTMSHLNLADKLGVALNSIEKELEESVPKELAMELICALSQKLGHWRVIPKLMNLVNPLEKCDKI
ncbi:unnamed protein product [Timema podura]|uniref:Telomere-associated protein Rif1 N-terminal domain-containing protein n=1 Tax=Timema podura TaxID=61482 RepID=A0ABN7NIP8_TIMPD|nr:unnamed protein product [Timema podura]